MNEKEFLRAASPFEVVPEATGDPRTVLYKRYMAGEPVLDELIQSHLMVPREKCVVPEILRLCARAPKTVNNLFRIAVTIGDRADDYARAIPYGKQFLEIYPRNDKPKEMMERLMAYWTTHETDTESRYFRLAHGDMDAILEEAESQEDPWISTMWLMHAADGGNETALRLLAKRELERGNTALAIRLLRNIPNDKTLIQEELEQLVFVHHDFARAEKLAWNLEDDSLSRWLRLIHYAQGTNHDTEGIEDLVDTLSESLSSDTSA